MLEGMLNDICGTDLFEPIYETVSMNLFGGSFSSAFATANTLHESVMKPVAVMLVFLYFMIAVVDKLTSENFTWEQLWRQMALLFAAYYLILHGFEILQILFNVGVQVTNSIIGQKETITAQAFDAAALIESFQDQWGNWMPKFIIKIMMVIFLIIPWLLSWIMKICVSVVCYSRIIEIYARATFAPIAISDFFHSGLQSGGWRFLKNFLAVSLQGAMLLVISILFSQLFNDVTYDTSNLFVLLGKYLALDASAIMLMFKSLSLTKELVGTG